MINDIGQINLVVKDMQRATAFYRDTLGLQFLFAIPDGAFFQCGTLRLYLALSRDPSTDYLPSILYFRVDDIKVAHAALVDKGVAFDQPPHVVASLPDHDLWLAFFRDSEGNIMALMCEVRGRN